VNTALAATAACERRGERVRERARGRGVEEGVGAYEHRLSSCGRRRPADVRRRRRRRAAGGDGQRKTVNIRRKVQHCIFPLLSPLSTRNVFRRLPSFSPFFPLLSHIFFPSTTVFSSPCFSRVFLPRTAVFFPSAEKEEKLKNSFCDFCLLLL
jgi:hypothetical protein